MARKKGGILKPEYRLWRFTLSLALVPFGPILWGVSPTHRVQRFGYMFTVGVIAFTNAVRLQMSVSYCIDSYQDLSGEALVTVILVRDTMSFASNYGLTPWVNNMGYQNAIFVAAVAGMAQCASLLLFVTWGKTLRRQSAPRHAKYVEKRARRGLMH